MTVINRSLKPTGIQPSGTILISENGEYDVTNFANANVNVSGSGSGDNKLASLVDKSITEVTADDLEGATQIGYSAFRFCSELTRAAIPNGVTSIGEYAFGNCSMLGSVTIPYSVTSTGDSAFDSCSNLSMVTYGGTIEDWLKISFSAYGSPLYTSNNALKVGGESGAEVDGDIIITDTTITSIPYKAFYGLQGITSISLPSSITSIDSYAFQYCRGLISVTIPDSVITIDYNAFRYTALTSVVIPDSVTSIGNYAFSNCTSLTNSTIGSGITNIGSYAFRNSNNLAEITIKATTPPTIASTSLPTASTVQTIYIPTGTLEAYSTKTNWTTYASKFVEIDME